MVSILSMVVIAGITCVVNQSSGSEKNKTNSKIEVCEYIEISDNELYFQKMAVELSENLSGYDASEKVIDKILERKELYRIAQDAGYSCSEEEYIEYVEGFKELIEDEETVGGKEMQSFIEEIGGEDAYWKLIEDVNKEKYVISKYFKDEKEKFFKKNKNLSDDDCNIEWDKNENKLRKNALKQVKKRISEGKMKQLEKTSSYTNENFENIKHIDENGVEYWYARELQKILE